MKEFFISMVYFNEWIKTRLLYLLERDHLIFDKWERITAEALAMLSDSAFPFLGIVIILSDNFIISFDGPKASLEKMTKVLGWGLNSNKLSPFISAQTI